MSTSYRSEVMIDQATATSIRFALSGCPQLRPAKHWGNQGQGT